MTHLFFHLYFLRFNVCTDFVDSKRSASELRFNFSIFQYFHFSIFQRSCGIKHTKHHNTYITKDSYSHSQTA